MPDSKSFLSLNNLKILRPKVSKNLTNFRRKFCESHPDPKKNILVDVVICRFVVCGFDYPASEL